MIRRKKGREQTAAEAQEQQEMELRARALRLVDTRGVVVREAEAELRAALAAVRSYSTPEREERLERAKTALEAAKRFEDG
jgi:hypothetical protein